MTIIADDAPRTRATPAAVAVAVVRGFITGGVIGGSLAAFFVAAFIESVPLVVAALGVPMLYGLLLTLAGAPRRAREAAVVPRTALAMVESLEAVGGESGDVPVRFDLTVAPQEGPAFRVETRQDINLVDLPDYRPRGVLVVEYPPDRPWRVRIVKRPTPEWEERAAGARLDSAPEPTRVSEPPESGVAAFVGFLGLLLGAAAVVLFFRADLFGDAPTAAAPPASSSSSSSSSTTTVSSSTATVTLGPGQSFLGKGELRRAVDALTKGKETRRTLTVVVQDRVLSVVFSPSASQAQQFDLTAPPYERFPALVEEARTTLGVHAPRTWQITVDGFTGSLTVRVSVTGSDDEAASLEADGEGRILHRTPSD